MNSLVSIKASFSFLFVLLLMPMFSSAEVKTEDRIRFEIVDGSGQRINATSKIGATVTFGNPDESRFVLSGTPVNGRIELKIGRIAPEDDAIPVWLTSGSVLPKQSFALSQPGIASTAVVTAELVKGKVAGSPEDARQCPSVRQAECCVRCDNGNGACSGCSVDGPCGSCCVGDCCG